MSVSRQGEGCNTPGRSPSERVRAPPELFQAGNATVDNRERRIAIGERLDRSPQIADDTVNPNADEQAERLNGSRRVMDQIYKDLWKKFSESAAKMKQVNQEYDVSTKSQRCKDKFDRRKERISQEVGDNLKKLLDAKPSFIDRIKYAGKKKTSNIHVVLDKRQKKEKIEEALGKFEFKKTLNIIEDKAPVRNIDNHVVNILKTKYPSARNQSTREAKRDQSVEPNLSELRKVLRRKKVSKHGISGLTFGELKAVNKDEALAESLLDLVTLILNGWVSGEGKEAIKTGRGIVLAKSWTGGDRRGEVKDVRPINAVESILSVADGLIYQKMRDRCMQLAGKNQMGLRPRGNQELAVTLQVWYDLVDRQVDTEDDLLDCVVLASLDLRNAFNTLCRSIILDFIEEEFPDLLGYFEWLYGDAFEVVFGEEKISSEKGVSQGSPSSALLFDAVLGIALKELIQEFESDGRLEIRLCHDGLFLLGKGSEVLKFKKRLEGRSESDQERILPRGLAFNTAKCEVLPWKSRGELVAGFNEEGWRILGDGGMMVAGIPVGSNRFREEATYLKTKTICDRITKTMDFTVESGHPLGFVAITKLCLLPSLVYWSTCVPVTHWPRQAIDLFTDMHEMLLRRLTMCTELAPQNSYFPVSALDLGNAKVAAITRLKLWSPGIHGLSAFISNWGCLEHRMSFHSNVLGISETDTGSIEQTRLYKAYKYGKRNLDDFLVKNGIVSKDLKLDTMNEWGQNPPESDLCSRITFFLVKAVEQRFPMGAYSSIFVRRTKTSLTYVENRESQSERFPEPSKSMRDTAVEFLHSGSKSSSKYLNMALSKNSGISPPSGVAQRFMLLQTLGFNFGSLKTSCGLCKHEVGGIAEHADCCSATKGDRNRRHNCIKYSVGTLLQRTPGLRVEYEPILKDHFNLKQGYSQEVREPDESDLGADEVGETGGGVKERGDWVVRSELNNVLGYWDLTIGGVLAKATDEGTPGSRTMQGDKAKVKKHKKYVDDEKKLHGFAMDTCGGIHGEVDKAINLWTKEVRGKHYTDEDDRAFFGARIRQCISMKLSECKAMRMMEVLRRAKNENVYPEKGETMKDWPTLGLGVLYDFFNARDGVVSEEPMYVDGILRRMAFNAEAEIRMGRYPEDVADVRDEADGVRSEGEHGSGSASTLMESQQYSQLQGYESGEENILSSIPSLSNGGVRSLSADTGSDLIRGESHGGSIRSRTSGEGGAVSSGVMRDDVGEVAMRDVQMSRSVEHGSGREASSLESMGDTQSSEVRTRSAGANGKKKVTKQKRVIESDPKLYNSTREDRRMRREASEGSMVSEAGSASRYEESGESNVIGNVDSGSSDQQESSVPATPVDSALGSQEGPS